LSRGGLFSVMCLAVLALAVPVAAAPAESLEYAVKATFLYKFAGFVEWPAAVFESASSPVTICVLGTDPVALLIDHAAAGQQIGERTFMVQHLQTLAGVSSCRILYVATNVPAAEAQNTMRGMPILTVTDSGGTAASARSIVTFVVQDNRVRFDIDDAAAAENGLTISSKLLSLARVVRPRP
jgi:YfiR/HmsC-like